MSSRSLNATAGSLLGFLHERPMSGWDLVETARVTIGDFWTVTRSQVYRELARLAADGLVEVSEPGPRDRREHTLTPAGRTAFRDWLQREPGPEQIRYPLLLTISFGRHLPPEQLAAFLTTHRAVHERRLADYQAVRADLPPSPDPYFLATLDFGIRYESAVLDWFDHLPTALTDGPAQTPPTSV